MATFRSLETLFRTKDLTNTAWIRNSAVLYALLFFSGVLLFGWMHLGRFHHVIVFVLTGLLAMYYTKNMTVVLFWCIAVSSATFFLYCGKEGLGDVEEEEEEDDVVEGFERKDDDDDDEDDDDDGKEGMENGEDGEEEQEEKGEEEQAEKVKPTKAAVGTSIQGSLQAQAKAIVAEMKKKGQELADKTDSIKAKFKQLGPEMQQTKEIMSNLRDNSQSLQELMSQNKSKSN